MTTITEAEVEAAGLAWLAGAGWGVAHGPDIAPETARAERTDYGQVVLEQRLRDALAVLNPDIPLAALDDAFRRLTRPEGATVEARNRAFHRMFVNGVTVEYQAGGAIRGDQVKVIDFGRPDRNDFLAVNQFTVTENRNTRRPDVVLFVNGLPLAIIELKNPADEDATIWTAWNQLQTYKADLPTLFSMNEVLMVSDGTEARVGTLTAGREWFKPWRTVSGQTLADPNITELQVMLQGVFAPARFLALIRDFIVFEDDGGGALAKKMAGYHQFHAIRVAVTETLRAAGLRRIAEVRGRYESGLRPGGEPGDRRIGVVWHTQGSGKSLTMAFYAGALIRDPSMEKSNYRRTHRPQRPRRPALWHILPLPGPTAPASNPGREPRRPSPKALGGVRRSGLHHHPEVLPRGEGRPSPDAVRAPQHRRHRRRGPPQPVRLRRRLRPPHA